VKRRSSLLGFQIGLPTTSTSSADLDQGIAATFRRFVVAASKMSCSSIWRSTPHRCAFTITAVGPTYPPEELTARTVLALFDRVEARDFVTSRRCPSSSSSTVWPDWLASWTAYWRTRSLQKRSHRTRAFTDDDLEDLGADPPALRLFADRWRERLTGRSG
jgi:hypothetical protein